MRKIIFLFLVLSPYLLFAQQEPVSNEQTTQNDQIAPTGFTVGGAIGSVNVDNVTYSEIRFLPEVSFGKIGVGLDIDLLIDKFGNIRKEDWDDSKDIINKIYYIRYAQQVDPFYFRVGGFPSYTLSHGLIMNQYSNMLKYPGVRQIGAMIGGNTKISSLGGEVFSSNLVQNEILTGRVHIKPMQTMNILFLKNLTVGISIATDRNQFGGLRDVRFDTDVDGVPDNADIDADNDGVLDASPYVLNTYHIPEAIADTLIALSLLDTSYPNYKELIKSKKESVTEYSFDYELPLIQKQKFYLSHYAEIAKIQDYKMGFIFPGFYSKFFIFEMNAELRHFQDQFIPGYFNQLYDQQRASTFYTKVTADSEVYGINTKKEIIANAKAATGWYAGLTTSLWDMVFLTITYQDMYSKEKIGGKSLTGMARVNPKIIPQVKEASITYSQINVDKIKKIRTPNAILEGKVAYGIAANTYLIGRYQELYIDIDNDGKISKKGEIQQIYGTSVEFRF